SRRLSRLAVPRLPAVAHERRPVLRRRLAALRGADVVRPRVRQDARAEGRRALLAHAPLRADHLLAQLPHGLLDAGAGGRLPPRKGGTRARQRGGGRAALVRIGAVSEPAALSGGVPARRPAAA